MRSMAEITEASATEHPRAEQWQRPRDQSFAAPWSIWQVGTAGGIFWESWKKGLVQQRFLAMGTAASRVGSHRRRRRKVARRPNGGHRRRVVGITVRRGAGLTDDGQRERCVARRKTASVTWDTESGPLSTRPSQGHRVGGERREKKIPLARWLYWDIGPLLPDTFCSRRRCCVARLG